MIIQCVAQIAGKPTQAARWGNNMSETFKGHMPTFDRIIDIFGRRNGRDSYFFNVFCELSE